MNFSRIEPAILRSWRLEFQKHLFLILFSLFILVLSLVTSYNAGRYADAAIGVHVTDLILDNFGPYDLGWFYTYVWIAIAAVFFIYPLIFKVNKLHEWISQFALLAAIRGYFIILTHLSLRITAVAVNFPKPIAWFIFQNDLFFSGQVSVAFLGYFVFKESKIRYFFLISSILIGIVSLLMHQHYSIDIFAAFFITYGSYKIGNKLFRVFKKTN